MIIDLVMVIVITGIVIVTIVTIMIISEGFGPGVCRNHLEQQASSNRF